MVDTLYCGLSTLTEGLRPNAQAITSSPKPEVLY